uniref:Uncharacterized protein n=1 Tax=Ditylenchus dipsaci TaxID=166011 RepID=A0A915E4L5_9BILA
MTDPARSEMCKSVPKAGGVAKPETPQYVLPPHATSSDTNLKKIIELVDIVNENVKLPFKGVTNFTVSFIDDGGQTVHSAAFKKAMHKTKTNDLAAFETVKNSWDKMLQTNKDLSFAHEQNPQAANSKHGEAEEDAGGDHKLGHAENHDVEEPQQSGNLEGAAEPSDIPEE